MTAQASVEAILFDAFMAAPEGVELVTGFDDPYGRVDALRCGDEVITMAEAVDIGGDPGDVGYGWSSGLLSEEGRYEDLTGAQWAEGEEQMREAVATWIDNNKKENSND